MEVIKGTITPAILPGWYVLKVNGIEIYRDNKKYKVQDYARKLGVEV